MLPLAPRSGQQHYPGRPEHLAALPVPRSQTLPMDAFVNTTSTNMTPDLFNSAALAMAVPRRPIPSYAKPENKETPC